MGRHQREELTMKLGRDTNSVTNWLLSGTKGAPEIQLELGVTGATLLHWTDRTACTVIGWDGKILTVQEDEVTRRDGRGMDENQEYDYAPNANGWKHHYKRDRKGIWTKCIKNDLGNYVICGGPGLRIGDRLHYHDFSF
jgi:hypothetical protein